MQTQNASIHLGGFYADGKVSVVHGLLKERKTSSVTDEAKRRNDFQPYARVSLLAVGILAPVALLVANLAQSYTSYQP